MPDEAFTFSYDEKRGVELDFFRRKKIVALPES
jgi:hypothetical protein